jgi:ABC-type multidrug transport system fused ATPase/permease subunit
MKVRNTRAISGPLVEMLAVVAIQLVACIVAYFIFRLGSSPEEFMTALLMLVASALSFRPVTAMHNEMAEASAAASRVLELLTLPVEPTGADAPENERTLPRHGKSIAFEHVTFRYRPEMEPAVNDVSFTVAAGQTVALVGSNGSGKTTVLSFLPRLLEPQEGRVLIDGLDVKEVSLRSLRKQMAVVTQQTVLFEWTIAQNIAYGRRHEPMEKIIAAAKVGHAHDFITQLPQGYDTPLTEGGVGLSGGQMQRTAIARAVLRNPAILILDEATGQIDSESEAEIGKALTEISVGRTTFVIAHRLSTVIHADAIIVMKDGRIIAQGRHEELLETCEMYRTLVNTQLFGPT